MYTTPKSYLELIELYKKLLASQTQVMKPPTRASVACLACQLLPHMQPLPNAAAATSYGSCFLI